jgi:hypothetical protein
MESARDGGLAEPPDGKTDFRCVSVKLGEVMHHLTGWQNHGEPEGWSARRQAPSGAPGSVRSTAGGM